MRLMLLCCTWKDERMGEEEGEFKLLMYPRSFLRNDELVWVPWNIGAGDASASSSVRGRMGCSAEFTINNIGRREIRFIIA